MGAEEVEKDLVHAFALGVAKFPFSAVSISCHSDRKDVKKEIKTQQNPHKSKIPHDTSGTFQKINRMVFLTVPTECSPFFWIPRAVPTSPHQFLLRAFHPGAFKGRRRRF